MDKKDMEKIERHRPVAVYVRQVDGKGIARGRRGADLHKLGHNVPQLHRLCQKKKKQHKIQKGKEKQEERGKNKKKTKAKKKREKRNERR
jgi:hypothetical protein